MDDLGVGSGVGEVGDRQGQQAARRRVGRRVGERKRDTLVIEDPSTALLAVPTLPFPATRSATGQPWGNVVSNRIVCDGHSLRRK